MAIGDIFTLNNSIGARLIRCLYTVMLIVIAVFVLLGVMRGVRIMTATPPPAATASAPPQAGAMMGAAPNRMMMQRMGNRDGRMGQRRYPRIFGNPALDGTFLILWSLLRGAIAVMIIRILSEMGLAVLAMPRRAEP